MPVGPAGYLAVVGYPRLQSSRTESGAYIHIKTSDELQAAKPADFRLAYFTG